MCVLHRTGVLHRTRNTEKGINTYDTQQPTCPKVLGSAASHLPYVTAIVCPVELHETLVTTSLCLFSLLLATATPSATRFIASVSSGSEKARSVCRDSRGLLSAAAARVVDLLPPSQLASGT